MSDDQKKDLTKIEDLSEYLHEEDPETDAVLDAANASRTDISVDVSELEEDSQIMTNDLPDTPSGAASEGTDSFNIEESIFDDQEVFEAPPEDLSGPEEENEDDGFSLEGTGEFQSEDYTSDDSEDDYQEEVDFSASEDEGFEAFEDSDSFEETESTEGEDIFASDGNTEEYQDLGGDNSDEDIFADDGNIDVTETGVSGPEPIQDSEPEAQNQTVSEVLVREEPVTDHYEPLQPATTEPEKFKDLNEFAKNISYGDVAAGGNPPYSIILKNIQFKEDAEDILIILRDHNLADDSNEDTFREALDNGSVLISQISEYSAIYLAHKFRRFNVDIQMGLSEELHPSTTYDKNEKGLISKHSLSQNEREYFSYPKESINVDNILLATTPTLENHIIRKYLSIVSTHKVIEEDELMKNTEKRADTPDSFDFFDKNEDKILENISFGLDEVYKELANELKQKCLKHGGNAVVGINFQLTPLFSNPENKTQINYKITATGNVVWVLRNGAPIERL